MSNSNHVTKPLSLWDKLGNYHVDVAKAKGA